MSLTPQATEWVVLGLRAAFVLLLYVVVFAVAGAGLRDVVAAATPFRRRAAPPVPDRLVVVDGARSGLPAGAWFPLADGATIGRAVGSPIRIDDEFVSGQHARLRRNGDDWVVADLGSTNGTFVNGMPAGGGTALGAGDVLQCGRVRLRLGAAPGEMGSSRTR